jgi:polyisoprenoid-binding protein YceI
VSKSVAAHGEGEYVVKGDLTIHGVTREVTLQVEGPTPEVKDPWGNMRAGVAATAKINRKDFGLGWNVALETGGLLVGEQISITLEMELIHRAA